MSGSRVNKNKSNPSTAISSGQTPSSDKTPAQSFPSTISEYDLHLFGEGKHWRIYDILGAHSTTLQGVEGVVFATWAPRAHSVSVIGHFNQWDPQQHHMHRRGTGGVWELFIPDLKAGDLYKFAIGSGTSGQVVDKSDPYGRQFEKRPSNAALVAGPRTYQWGDQKWLQDRHAWPWQHAPMSIYEVHLASWRHNAAGHWLNYRELAHELVDYVTTMGFTHIELLPVTEHPLDESWGYQTTGYFAPTSRFGSPDDFRYFVDHCHQHGIGLILDWVPGHFPKDDHALARFDGTALYEHVDPRQGEHRDWGTLIFNYGSNEVRNFLLASALYWLDEFHLDGLRVDAVASMLYLDYSREEGDWIANIHGSNENLEAITFLKELNSLCQGQYPGTLMMAEESTSWPKVTRPPWEDGLGFATKWNMGWMHDTLEYMMQDPIHRKYHHDSLSFGLLYAFNENFLLPLSHDEVVHGKRSLLEKMPGDEWRKRANLRLLFGFMYAYPGSKLLFMGGEFGQSREWSDHRQLDWDLLESADHAGIQHLVRDLNHLYREEPALHLYNYNAEGFEWIDCNDASQSVVSFMRKSDSGFVVVVLNFTPITRDEYRIGVPVAGVYHERINTDSSYYGGSNTGNLKPVESEPVPWMGKNHSISLTLPPLGALILSV
ncbi:MAG: 1,4-alpha-glucan branching protein GlgB [Oleiphilaceae bacterium]|nr:1,4-alpha-glucan branching protein GlgB [Oleiphilaceae bacterium]